MTHYQNFSYEYACQYFRNNNKRNHQAEMDFIDNPCLAFCYANNMLKDRWPEAEPVIIQDSYYAFRYASEVIKDRWPEAEPIILNSCWKKDYENFLKTEHEKFFEDSKNQNPGKAYHYCVNQVNGRCKEAEKYIIQAPSYSYLYAKYVIKDRWLEAEPVIIQDSYYAYLYSRYIIKDRWQEAEPIILNSMDKEKYQHFVNSLKTEHEKFFEDPNNQNANSAYYYCLEKIQGRCKEAEKYIIQSSGYAYLYAYNVIKTRWPEAEPIILNSFFEKHYINFLKTLGSDYIRGYNDGYNDCKNRVTKAIKMENYHA